MTDRSKHVAVVGAGIVGVSAAIWLQRAGHRVTIIDKTGPAAGASHGNAGVLTPSSVVVPTTPGLIWRIPKMLVDPQSPLFVRWSYLPRALPWLARYLSHSGAATVRGAADVLTTLLHDSIEQHQALAKGTGADKWIVPSDFIYAYADKGVFEGERFEWEIRRQIGVEWEEMEAAAFRRYDPAFADADGFVVRLPGHGYISDPGRYVAALCDHFEARGGALRIAQVVDMATEDGRVTAVITDKGRIDADEMIVAAGAWSGPMAQRLGVRVPLESKRGYHVEFVNPNVVPRAPTMIAQGQFVITPMEGRLRCAGVAEFGGLDAGPSSAPIELLKRQTRDALPHLTYDRVEEWMGHRPATSDSLPVIGRTGRFSNAHLAFGHQHVGMTGGPKTGRLVADAIGGGTSNIDLSAFSPRRFERGRR